MAHIVFAWELGGGYGHVGPFLPVAEELVEAGHKLTLIVKDLRRTGTLFSGLDVQLLQAPVKLDRAIPYNPKPVTFAHLLLNMGYQDPLELAGMIGAWRNLLHLARPDLLLFDHSPTAMLAARGMNVPQLTMGTGFCCPPDEFPLPPMAPWREMDAVQRQRDEMVLVERINTILTSFSQPQIERIGQIYSDVDRNLLTTFQELDHYPQRKDGTYLGTWSAMGTRRAAVTSTAQKVPEWPTGDGPKIYAYLKASKAVPDLLRWIGGQGLPLVVVSDSLDTARLSELVPGPVQFHSRPLPMEPVCRWCDLAILNANHGTTCQLLLAGRPQLHLPLTFEQSILAQRVGELGAALTAAPDQSRQAIQQLSSLFDSERFRREASAFAHNKAGYSQASSVTSCTNHILQHLE